MAENQDEKPQEEMCEEEQFREPPSLADHQILLHSAKRILKKARQFKRRKNQTMKANRVEYGKEIVLEPRLGGKPIKVIKVPAPKEVSENSKESVASTSKMASPKDPLSQFDPLPGTTKMVGKSGQPVSLTIGERKVFVRPVIQPKSPIKSPSKPEQTESNESEQKSEKPKVVAVIRKPVQKLFVRPVIQPKSDLNERAKALPRPLKRPKLIEIIKRNNFQARKPLPKVIARGRISRKYISQSSDDDDDEIPIPSRPPKDINPEDFPKAIVYPEAPKEKPPLIIKSVESKSPFTFNHVFEEIAMQPSKRPQPTIAQTLRNTVQPVEHGMAKPIPKEPNLDEIRKIIGISQDSEDDKDESPLIIDEDEEIIDDEVEDQLVAVVEGKRKPNFVNLKQQSENKEINESLDDSDEQFEVVVENDANTSDVDMEIDHELTTNETVKSIDESHKSTAEEKETNLVEIPNTADVSTIKIGNVTVTKVRPAGSSKMADAATNSNNQFRTFVTSSGKTIRIPVQGKITLESSPPKTPSIRRSVSSSSPEIVSPENSQAKNIVVPQPKAQPKTNEDLNNSIITIDDDDDEEESSDEEQFEVVSNDSTHENVSDDDFEIPPRPESNTELMNLLSNYRIFARYLMLKKNIQPFNFDSVDSNYIDVYKSLKK